MNILTENTKQITDILALATGQTNTTQNYTDTAINAFDKVLDNLKVLNNDAKKQEEIVKNTQNNTKNTQNNTKNTDRVKNGNRITKNTHLKGDDIVDAKNNTAKTLNQKERSSKEIKDTQINQNQTTEIRQSENNQKTETQEKSMMAENSADKTSDLNNKTTKDINVTANDTGKTNTEEIKNQDILDSKIKTDTSETNTTETNAQNNVQKTETINFEALSIAKNSETTIDTENTITLEDLNTNTELTSEEPVSDTKLNLDDTNKTSENENENENENQNTKTNNSTKSTNVADTDSQEIDMPTILQTNTTEENDIKLETKNTQEKVSTISETTNVKTNNNVNQEIDLMDTLTETTQNDADIEIKDQITENMDTIETETQSAATENIETNDTKNNIKKGENQVKETNKIQGADNTKKIDEMLEHSIDEIDIETQDTTKTQTAKPKVAENISESLIKAQITTNSAQATELNQQATKLQTNNTQVNLKEALSSQVNKIQTSTTTQNNLNLSQGDVSGQPTNIQAQNINTTSLDNNQFSTQMSKLTSANKMTAQTETQTTLKNDVLNQVTTKFEQLKDGTTSKVNIILRPENLGKVGVELVSRPDGVSARILADTAQVKDLLDKNLDILKNSLQTQGVHVNNITVKVVEGVQNTELSFSQNFEFSNQDNPQQNQKLNTELENEFSNRQYEEETQEEPNQYFTKKAEEHEPELERAEKIYSQHKGAVDLVV